MKMGIDKKEYTEFYLHLTAQAVEDENWLAQDGSSANALEICE